MTRRDNLNLDLPPRPVIDIELRNARGLRLAIVRNQLRQSNLTREQAEELLRGCLVPGNEMTRIDDSDLIDTSIEELRKIGIIV